MSAYIYILTNNSKFALYIGVTSDLIKRIYEHKSELHDGFSKKYNTKNLVYYEVYESIENAILREKQLKKWNRKWKEELIEKFNHEYKDLYDEILA